MTITAKKSKPLEVVKDDGTVVKVRRCSVNDLELLTTLQDRLLGRYIEEDGAFGTIILDPSVQADLTTVCSLLPLEQKIKGETEYLKYEDIKDNWEQLILLFFNGSFDYEVGDVTDVSTSLVSKYHFLPYGKMLRNHLAQVEKDQKEKEKDSQS